MEERIIAADPVADPQGYRRELLALLGGLLAGHARAHHLQLEQTIAAVRR